MKTKSRNKLNVEDGSIHDSMHHHVLSLEYLCFLTGPQPADIFWVEQNDCKLILYLTTKYVFENLGGGDFSVVPLVAVSGVSRIRQARPRTEFAKKLWEGQTLLFEFRWRHHGHSTVVRPFCKIGQIGYIMELIPGYAHRGGIENTVTSIQWCYI